ncbi:uncharacterized protein MYCGRDRAFT_102920 [Zymoseptoria tritici IPO323]|uniref:Uncharacterized protein n=1 Tax=Zymoseptoria tritici (strain CBS 115943 / IPO323) TaxID=336722 RepID=F9X0S4_ZYMTI|nr:uncharacterized protein MYCGRDRAFT_102920 [Zymoseptoria tritici IPO323]EGP91905.1 hypothetical protein MYCGRDRAFT_102920 [Zymoseptoria tritici IPO323]
MSLHLHIGWLLAFNLALLFDSKAVLFFLFLFLFLFFILYNLFLISWDTIVVLRVWLLLMVPCDDNAVIEGAMPSAGSTAGMPGRTTGAGRNVVGVFDRWDCSTARIVFADLGLITISASGQYDD